MKIEIPNVPLTLNRLMDVESKFNNEIKKIKEWKQKHHDTIEENKELLKDHSEHSKIKILKIFLGSLLVRAISGESGQKFSNQLENSIKSESDLCIDNYIDIFKKTKYRWGEKVGIQVIEEVVQYFTKVLRWNWTAYINEANEKKDNNFKDDELLKIKNIKYKLRDLALSNFSHYYAAFDLHVTRIVTRIGWLNYGWELLSDNNIEMGNNASDEKNYLFLHKLFIRLSELTEGEYTPVDLDRTFWHLGKSKCGANTKCKSCLINDACLTGKIKGRGTVQLFFDL